MSFWRNVHHDPIQMRITSRLRLKWLSLDKQRTVYSGRRVSAFQRGRESPSGRNDLLTSSRFREANLQRPLSGDESDEPSVRVRPVAVGQAIATCQAGNRVQQPFVREDRQRIWRSGNPRDGDGIQWTDPDPMLAIAETTFPGRGLGSVEHLMPGGRSTSSPGFPRCRRWTLGSRSGVMASASWRRRRTSRWPCRPGHGPACASG